jgi:hypothetical protein
MAAPAYRTICGRGNVRYYRNTVVGDEWRIMKSSVERLYERHAYGSIGDVAKPPAKKTGAEAPVV